MAIMDKKKEEKDEKERLKAERKRLQAERKQLKAENKRLLAEKRASKLSAKKSGKSVSQKCLKLSIPYVLKTHLNRFLLLKNLNFLPRFENGFDLTHDDRYNLWLKENGSPQNGVYNSVWYTAECAIIMFLLYLARQKRVTKPTFKVRESIGQGGYFCYLILT